MEKRTARVGAKALQFWRQSEAVPAEKPQEPSTPTKAGKPTPKLLKHPHLHHWALFGSFFIFAMLLASWLVGSFHFRNLTVGDRKVAANTSVGALKQIIDDQAQGYKLTIVAPHSTPASYTLSEAGITIDPAASARALHAASQQFTNRLLWWQPVTTTLVTSTNPEKLGTFIKQRARIEVTPVTNAQLTINSDGSIAVANETQGREYGLPAPEQTILAAVQHLQLAPLTLQDHSVTPSITVQSLASSKTQLEQTLQQKISFSLDGKTVQPNAHDIGAWLVITPNEKAKKYDISVDAGKVGDYINKIAAANVRRPRDQVEVTHADGSKVVLVKGVNGLDVINKDAVTKQVSKDLLNLKGLQVSLDVNYSPFKTVSTTGGDKLVEVDITTKRMFAYENDQLVRTFLISAGAPATPTVTGQFAIYSKVRIQDMRGFNADGSKYLQPDVEYVNYFYRDYAVHGNYWRPTSYFGNVNSSHGCVGIVNSDAAWFYDWATVGTTVVVHT